MRIKYHEYTWHYLRNGSTTVVTFLSVLVVSKRPPSYAIVRACARRRNSKCVITSCRLNFNWSRKTKKKRRLCCVTIEPALNTNNTLRFVSSPRACLNCFCVHRTLFWYELSQSYDTPDRHHGHFLCFMRRNPTWNSHLLQPTPTSSSNVCPKQHTSFRTNKSRMTRGNSLPTKYFLIVLMNWYLIIVLLTYSLCVSFCASL